MPKSNKINLKAIFKQINAFKETVNTDRLKKDEYYRDFVKQVISGMRSIVLNETPVEMFVGKDRWETSFSLRFGTMMCSDSYAVKYYWPESVKAAMKKRDKRELRYKSKYYFNNGKYYDKGKFFIDCDGKVRDKDKYYQGRNDVAYSKEKYIFATDNGEYLFKKNSDREVYEKKIPEMSSVVIETSRWSGMTSEFVWSMFEYDGKRLPDLTRKSYGFSFKNLNKLKFNPNKEQKEILQKMKEHANSDTLAIYLKFYKKEKSLTDHLDFIRRIAGWNHKVQIDTMDKKLEALKRVVELKNLGGENATTRDSQSQGHVTF